MLGIPTHRKIQSLKDKEFEASLGYIGRLCFSKSKQNPTM
jgi:hypothetical protein